MAVTQGEIKDIKSLSTRKGRRRLGRFAAEGVRLLEEAVRHRFLPEAVYVCEAQLSDRGRQLVDACRSLKLEVRSVSSEQMRRMSDTKTPQGILARFAFPPDASPELWRAGNRSILLCEDINDPGNLGTLARSALAFGFEGLALVGSVAEPFAPKVLRASAGALFALKVTRVGASELDVLLSGGNRLLIAADLRGEPIGVRIDEIRGARNVVLALGSEAEGLSEELLRLAGLRVRLEHDARVESLNVGVAGSILMKQIYDAN